jgi:dolichyl-diphosphooligosaccharide--protein glycosyltransferase
VYGLRARGVARPRAWAGAGLGLGAAAVLVLAAGSGSVGRGLEFLLQAEPVAGTLLESRSLVETGPGYAFRWLTPVGLSLPVLWVAAVLTTARRQERMDALLAAALALGALAVPFAFLQTRFGPHAAVASGLLLAWLVHRVERPLVAAGAVVVAAGTLAWGVRPATLPDSAVHPYLLGGFDAVAWLRREAPPTSHFHRPVLRPEYGVAAEWVWGHWITQIGRKPNVANPLSQTPENLRGIDDVARLFLADSETEAMEIAERRDVRYLLLSSIPVTVSQLAVQAGRDPARYVTRGDDGSPTFHPAFFGTFHSRLYLGGGAREGELEAVSRARLVFESRARIDFLGPRPTVRIFEIVPGALLRGRCVEGEVEARAVLASPALVWTARTPPGPDGDFVLRVPYASEAGQASIAARITVRCGDRETVVEVAERDVREGREVVVTPGRDGSG